jgi:amidohydrolase
MVLYRFEEDCLPIPFLEEALELRDELVAIRRDLHAHPELGFQEVRTAGIVAEKLSSLGYEVMTGVGQTGVVGFLGNGQPDARRVLLRFDMDALPIQEENDVPYRSQTPGVMHACGHDAHVAVGLGVATLLARHQDRFDGTIKLMFQPAEETVDGAMGMIREGVLDGVDAALALHVYSGFPTGTTVVRSGALMAAADEFRITVQGRGGHAAHPEEAIDSVLVASQIVCSLQTIVSRSLNPEETGVVTVGSIHAGEAHNVIAASAVLRGTIRAFSEEVRSLLHTRVDEIARGVAATFGAAVEVHIRRGVDPTVNAPGPTAVMHRAVTDILGSDNINTTYRTTGGEDFSAVLARVPGTFLLLGARDDERGFNYPHHNPRFDIDEACLPQGVAILCDAALRCLRGEHEG